MDSRRAVTRGVRLGVDVGKVRIGLASSDPDGLIATPIATVARVPDGQPSARSQSPASGKLSGPGKVPAQGLTADIEQIVQEAGQRDAAAVYVGLPLQLDGRQGAAAADARGFARRLADALYLADTVSPVPVFLVDERMTTVTATSQLHEAGRRVKSHRAVIDQQAAVIILQTALDTERQRGRRAGVDVGVSKGMAHS